MRKPVWRITAVFILCVLFIILLGMALKEPVQAGNGSYYNSNQTVGTGLSQRVALADIDGDTDLDAFVVNSDGANGWWRNTNGVFSNSG